MKIHEHRILILSIIFPLYLLLLWFLSGPFLGQFFFNQKSEQGLLSAASYDRRNATYHYVLGRFYHYTSEKSDMTNAIRYYRDSLRLSPLQGGCWLDLAKAYQTAGLIAEAGEAIDRAVRLIPKNPAVMWEAGVFYLIHNDIERSVKNFKKFILLQPERQNDAYDILWKLPLNSQYVLENLIPDSYPYYKGYLLYLTSTDRINESKELWKVMEGLPVEDTLYLKYSDFLISRHHYQDAEKIWKYFIDKKFKDKKEEPSLIWNGGFEHEIQHGGFDWRIRETQGVDVFLDRDIHLVGSSSIGITFDGTENPGITVASQIVRVIPGAHYVLRGNIKTDSLTTTNGLFFSIRGHDCGFNRRSEVITGTNFWREVNLEVDVPAGCNAISVSIKRDKSNKLDNKISGNAWIDGISLTQR